MELVVLIGYLLEYLIWYNEGTMNTWNIKGSCENCGFVYKGTVSSIDSYFPRIKCPACNIETLNFDEANEVNKLDKSELAELPYKESVFEIIK